MKGSILITTPYPRIDFEIDSPTFICCIEIKFIPRGFKQLVMALSIHVMACKWSYQGCN